MNDSIVHEKVQLQPGRAVCVSSQGPATVSARVDDGDVTGAQGRIEILCQVDPAQGVPSGTFMVPPHGEVLIERRRGFKIAITAMPLPADFMQGIVEQVNALIRPFGRQLSLRCGLQQVQVGAGMMISEVVGLDIDPTLDEIKSHGEQPQFGTAASTNGKARLAAVPDAPPPDPDAPGFSFELDPPDADAAAAAEAALAAPEISRNIQNSPEHGAEEDDAEAI